MTHQTLSLEKYWKLFPATLKLNRKKCVSVSEIASVKQRMCKILESLGKYWKLLSATLKQNIGKYESKARVFFI